MQLHELLTGYISLRDKIAEEEAAAKLRIKPKKDMMEKIEQALKKHLDESHSDSLSVKGVGTAFKKTVTSVTVADWDLVWEYIQTRKAWDVLNHAVNKTAVIERLKEEGELLPGVNMSEYVDIQVRRA